MSLLDPAAVAPEPDALYEAFTGWAEGRGLTPYPAQADALLELVTGSNVILATPTGSGKSLVATGLEYATAAQGGRTFYTAPIKALVSEKFFTATEIFGPERVGMMTGDASVNPDADIICCTAEVLANVALRQGPGQGIASVVMDEFHFYADPDRGWAWQVPLLELRDAQFLLMSATLGDVTRFERDLTRRTGSPDRGDRLRRAPGAAALRVGDHPGARDHRGAARHPSGAHLRRALQSGRGHRAGPGPEQPAGLHPGGEGPDRRPDRRLPLLRRLRQGAVPAGPQRHRGAPRRDAAEVPPVGRAARPGRAAQDHLRHRHPRGGDQRADPYGAVHLPSASTTG